MFKFNEVYKVYQEKTEQFFEEKQIKDIKTDSQYFTPIKQAEKLLDNIRIIRKNEIKILDPCCGNGILLLKLLERIVNEYQPEYIFIDAYDIDGILLKNVQELIDLFVFDKIQINLKCFKEDFLTSIKKENYDYIVMNPPFKKINVKDVPDDMKDILYGQPNLYHLFIKKALDFLNIDGELCIISPKNYLSGRYTEGLRNYILNNFSIVEINTFNDRKNIFKNNITQEICMVHIMKCKQNSVIISYNEENEFKVNINDVITGIRKNIILTPRNINDYNLLKSFSKFPIGTIGTEILARVGKVVQFRVKEKEKNLVNKEFSKYENGIPLIVYRHINGEKVNYRRLTEKLNDAITMLDDGCNATLLTENENYLLIRKNIDKKYDKLIHSVKYLKDLNCKKIAIDNGIIYFTNKDDSLTECEVRGLHCILKSKQFDAYYRMINSTHTINVYELENMNFPSLSIIREIGMKINNYVDVNEATEVFEGYLH